MSFKNLIETMGHRVQQRCAETWSVVECAELINKLVMEYCVTAYMDKMDSWLMKL